MSTVNGLAGPRGLVVDDVVNRVHVADGGVDYLAVIDAEANEVVHRVPVGS